MYSFLSFDLWWIFRWFLLLDGRQSNWIHLWSINRNQGDIVMWKIWCHAAWRILDRALWLSHRILRQYPQEIRRWGTSRGQELVLHVRHPDCFRAPVVPCPYPLTTPTPTPSSPCRRCCCRPCTAAGPCGGICRAPEKPALLTSPANKGRGGNRIGGRAGCGWLKHSWACISVIDDVVSNTALSAGQNCSSESSSRAAYRDWIVRIITCQYVPACTI